MLPKKSEDHMKAKFIAFFAVLAIALTGCKNEKSVDNLEVVKPEVVDNTFKATFKVTVKKDDDFSLYYTEDGSINFSLPAVWVKVKGSDSPQDVVFTLPEDVIPTQLRFDPGMNQSQDDIVFQGFKLEYMGKTFEKSGAEVATYFYPDATKCTFDPATGTVKAIGEKKYPSFYPSEAPMTKAIESIVK